MGKKDNGGDPSGGAPQQSTDGVDNAGTGDNWTESGLLELTEDQLLDIAAEYELAFDHAASKEELVAAILKAQEPDQTPSQDNGGDPAQTHGETKPQETTPKADDPPKDTGEKVRVKCASLAGGKEVVVGAETVKADQDGVIEVAAAQADRLLTIPGYEKA